MEVLLEVVDYIFKSGDILRRRGAKRFVRVYHLPRAFMLFLLRALAFVSSERSALWRARTVRMNAKNLIETKPAQKVAAARTATHNMEMSVTQLF